MGAFFQALAFLTRIPVPKLIFSESDWQKSVAYYPLVGVILGVIMWGIASVLPFLFSVWLSAALLLVLWVFLTGGLHLDGWMDLADGLGSHRSQDRMLEIMKDSRVGAMGVLAAVLLLIVKLMSIGDLLRLSHPVWLFLPPLIARFVLVCAMRFWPYISKNGLGQGLGKGADRWSLSFNLVLVCILVWCLDRVGGLFVLGLSLAAGFGWISWVHRKLGGLTGDCYGATVEWTEAVVLIMMLLVGRFV